MKSKNYFSNLSQKQLDNLLSTYAVIDRKKAKELLELGANPNISGLYGWTPLMNAVHAGDLELTKTLISFGANVNPKLFNLNIIACRNIRD